MKYKSAETQVTLNIISHIFDDVLNLIVKHVNENKRLTTDFLKDYNKLREKYIEKWDI